MKRAMKVINELYFTFEFSMYYIYHEDMSTKSIYFPWAIPPTFLPASSSDPTPGMRLKSTEVVVVCQHRDLREDEHL